MKFYIGNILEHVEFLQNDEYNDTETKIIHISPNSLLHKTQEVKIEKRNPEIVNLKRKK